MNFLKRHPVFTTIIALFALLILAEAWYVHVLRTGVLAAERDVRERLAEIDRLQRERPTPIGENLRLAREDVAQNAEVLANMLRILSVAGPDELSYFQGEPGTRADAWFEISQFVDRMTNEAKKSSVELKPDERFGFSAFANEGPEPAYIRSVYRQHRIAEYLLGILFAARPRALLAMQREEPVPVTPGEGVASAGVPAPAPAAAPTPRSAGNSGSAPNEIFVIDPQVSARTPGYVDTLAFRIIFSGHTTSLRGFMNALAAPEIPLVVRSVEVVESAASSAPRTGGASSGGARPANPPGRPASAAAAAGPAATGTAIIPIVAENASIFTVTVELFDVKTRVPQVTAMSVRP